jgi:hypothetical protein
MKTRLYIQLLIIIVALAVVLPLAFSNQSSTVYHSVITGENATQSITFELQNGQVVTGSLTYYSNDFNGAWFMIYGPEGDPLVTSSLSVTREQNHGTFKFTASQSGRYSIGVNNNDGWSRYLDYSYIISSPVLGFDPFLLIALVIGIAIVLTGINILVNWVVPRKKLNLCLCGT